MMSVRSAGALVLQARKREMTTETVRVLSGCILNGSPRKPSEIVPGVNRMDALGMVVTGQVEIMEPMADPAAAEVEAEATDGSYARPARRSQSRAR